MWHFMLIVIKFIICMYNFAELEPSNLHVLWEQPRGDVPIFFSGIPFVLVGKEERCCQHGPPRKKVNVSINAIKKICLNL